MKKRKFGEGGEIPPGGRFDSDTYKRARAWIEAGSPERESDTPVRKTTPAASKITPAVTSDMNYSNEGRSRPSQRAEIPGADPRYKAPAEVSDRRMSDMELAALTTAGALGAMKFANAARGAAGVLGKIAARRAAPAAAPVAAPAAAPAAKVAESINAPAVSRDIWAEIAPKLRNASLANKSSSPVARGSSVQSASSVTKTGKSPRDRTRFNSDEKNIEFSKGGTVKGCGLATRGNKYRIR